MRIYLEKIYSIIYILMGKKQINVVNLSHVKAIEDESNDSNDERT